MLTWSAVRRRLRALFQREVVEREMDEELALHLELEARAREREGKAPADAHRAARVAFGGVASVKEAYRDARGLVWLEQFRQDVGYAVRTLRRRPLFTIVTAAMIALGTGAATAIYSIVDGVLLRPLPYREAGQLVRVWRTFPHLRGQPGVRQEWNQIPLSLPEFRDLAEQATSFDGVAIWLTISETLVEGAVRERVPTVRASASMLDVLGVQPVRGRNFLPEEDRPGAPGAALVSFETWQQRYGGDEQIVGRTIHFEDRLYTIVGVLPPGLRIGLSGMAERALGLPAFWLPANQPPLTRYDDRASRGYDAIARLRPGVTLDAARAEAQALLGERQGSRAIGTHLAEWHAEETRQARAPLLLLLAGAGLLLLIVCVNVATLLTGEAVTREHEMAARLALGAGRNRLVRQLLTESLTLAAVGGALGLAVAAAGTRVLVTYAPVDVPGVSSVSFDLRVAAIAMVAVALTGTAFGLAPAVAVSGTRPASILRVGVGQSRRGRGELQRALVAVELALSMVLLASAGLLSRTFRNVTAIDPGFEPAGVFYINTILPREAYGISVHDDGSVVIDSMLVQRIYGDARAALARFPGVSEAVVGASPPFMGGAGTTRFALDGEREATADTRRRAQDLVVSPGYFRLMGIPLLSGRDFEASDRWGSPDVAIVNAALARRDFPTGSPIGRRIIVDGRARTIVGVVGDVRSMTLTDGSEPELYTPFAQRGDIVIPTLIVRTAGAPLAAATIRETLAGVDGRLIVTAVHRAAGLIDRTFAEERYRALLMSLFGVLAAVFSAIGLYGVTARAVARRTRDAGIRLALGATGGSVVRLMMRHTLGGVAVGIAAGVVLALLATRALSPFLFGVGVADPVTYVAVVLVLVGSAALASWLPARRLRRLNIVRVLRAD
ncbi:MAG TPA: ABC transporter permease [Gemmatimonadaceae bacterium]